MKSFLYPVKSAFLNRFVPISAFFSRFSVAAKASSPTVLGIPNPARIVQKIHHTATGSGPTALGVRNPIHTIREIHLASTFKTSICSLILLMFLAGCLFPGPVPAPPLDTATPTVGDIQEIADQISTATPFQPLPLTGIIQTPTPTVQAQTRIIPTIRPTHTPSPTPIEFSPSPTPTAISWPSPYFGGPGPTPVTPVPPPMPVIDAQGASNILLLGADRGRGVFRTDTLIIVSIRPKDRLVTMISIPRDLFIYIPGWTMQRINTAYFRGESTDYPGGGPALIKDTIRYNLGVQIDRVVMVDFDGFRGIIDTLGGIDIPLACSFTDWHITDPEKSDQDPNNWHLHTIGPGVVHMDGDLALWYARSRLRSSDFDRGRRQQEVLRAVYARGLKLDVIPRIYTLYRQLISTVSTDVTLSYLFDLAPLATRLSAPQIRSYFIDRTYVQAWRTPQGWAVQLPKYETLTPLLQEAFSPPDEEDISKPQTVVEIWNGAQWRDLDVLAAERLHYAGFDTLIEPADDLNHTQTLLYDLTVEQDEDLGRAILRALGLPNSSLIHSPEPESAAPFRLVLGQDYDPCFNPARITR